MTAGWVYIVTNQPNRTLYTGVTNDIRRRMEEHKAGNSNGFTQRYGLTSLVFVEHHTNIVAAIRREKNIKHWLRAWKIRLIEQNNPGWNDLTEGLPFDTRG